MNVRMKGEERVKKNTEDIALRGSWQKEGRNDSRREYRIGEW
jgi:hypothetical protein